MFFIHAFTLQMLIFPFISRPKCCLDILVRNVFYVSQKQKQDILINAYEYDRDEMTSMRIVQINNVYTKLRNALLNLQLEYTKLSSCKV